MINAIHELIVHVTLTSNHVIIERDLSRTCHKTYLQPNTKLTRPTMARGRGAFGLSSTRAGDRGRGTYRGRAASWRGGRGRGRGGTKAGEGGPKREDDGTQLAERFERVALGDEVDEKLGFARLQEGGKKEGWLVNMHPVSLYFRVSRLHKLIFLKKDPD